MAPNSGPSLNSVLPTTLDVYDEGFYELVLQRMLWWDSPHVRARLLEKGYTLYDRLVLGGEPSDLMYPLNVEWLTSIFPFANHEGPATGVHTKYPAFTADTGGRGIIGYAQDVHGNHVAIKTVLSGSEELRILKYINQNFSSSMDSFQNVLPVLEIFEFESHWLVVMPRWGDYPLKPQCETMKEAFHFIHCLLKDIKLDNILVNHAERCQHDNVNGRRRLLRVEGRLTYALFDFSHATMFPLSLPINKCYLPSDISFRTLPWQRPSDTHQGEIDFDPFAFDVGIMTTRDISKRFTASEALLFFEEHVDRLTSSQEALTCPATPLQTYLTPFNVYDRWNGLDSTFVLKWSAYREPPIPRHVQFLWWFCDRPWGRWLVLLVRRCSRNIRKLLGKFNLVGINGLCKA
ncbi:hypothetical protein H0H92_005016 [Tricholoma furcatifolium]|nr:hypothetical protein H0H92_005016 [Tricholoma furcatifolium]